MQIFLCKKIKKLFTAVKRDGWALMYADESYKKIKKCTWQFKKLGALQFVDKSLKNDEEIVNCALADDIDSIKYASNEFQLKHRDLLYKAMERNHHLFATLTLR